MALLVLIWLPPLWQQVSAEPGQGNLTKLVSYFLHLDPAIDHGPSFSWGQALSAFGQILGVPILGWPGAASEMDAGHLSAAIIGVGLGTIAVSALLVPIGARTGLPLVRGIGIGATAGLLAGLLSTKLVSGGAMLNYLIMWISAIPIATFTGYLLVLVHAAGRLQVGKASAGADGLGRSFRPAVAYLLIASLAVTASVSLVRAAGRTTDFPGVEKATQVTLDALPPPAHANPVSLRIQDREWELAAGLSNELERAGYQVTVDDFWTLLWRRKRAHTGSEPVQISVGLAHPDRTEPGTRSLALIARPSAPPAEVTIKSLRP